MRNSVSEIFMLEHLTFIRVFKHTIAVDCKKKYISGAILALRGNVWAQRLNTAWIIKKKKKRILSPQLSLLFQEGLQEERRRFFNKIQILCTTVSLFTGLLASR